MQRFYSYDPETKNSKCIIIDGNNKFEGIATCHPEDREKAGEYRGLTIAETRANIKMLKHIRDNELVPASKALEHLNTNLSHSSHYNPSSYEAYMLRRQCRIKREEIEAINEQIAILKNFLRDYININIF